MENRIKELIAIGASVTANCHPCLAHHLSKARHDGASESDIAGAIAVGKMVRKGASGKTDQFVATVLGTSSPKENGSREDCVCR